MKYFSHKITNALGVFDSKREYAVFLKLLDRQNCGEIYGLRRQVRLRILPQLTYTVAKQLKTKTKYVTRVDEKAKHYTSDFAYYDMQRKAYILCEVKSKGSLLARDYHLRRHLVKIILRRHNAKGKKQWVFNEVL